MESISLQASSSFSMVKQTLLLLEIWMERIGPEQFSKNLNKSKLSSVQKNEHNEDVRSEIFLFLVQMANIPKNGQIQMVVSLNLY
jgi:hypothetical protein